MTPKKPHHELEGDRPPRTLRAIEGLPPCWSKGAGLWVESWRLLSLALEKEEKTPSRRSRSRTRQGCGPGEHGK